jgi:capsular polysaccharide biosynthesis protein
VSDGDRTVGASLDTGDDLTGRSAVYDDFTAGDERQGGYSTGIPTLHFIAAALRRGMWLWCATAAAGLVIGLGLFVAHPPPFKASTSVVLVPNPDELPTDAILTDVALAQSHTVAERAMHQLGVQEPASSFVAAYTVTAVTDRVLLITVGAPSSSEAVARAGALATAFLQFRAQQAQSQEQHVLASLQQQVTQAKQHIKSVKNDIARLPAQPASAAQRARLASLQAQLGQANSELPSLQQAVTSNQVGARLSATQMVQGSQVLDRAAPIPHSRFKRPALFAVGGLLAGLVLGMGSVVVWALVSDRLRRRDDVAHALGAPVWLSVGATGLRGWRARRKGLAAAEGRDLRRIVAHLRGEVPAGHGRAAALAVVAVDEADLPAVCLAALAVACAQEGRQVVLADLCAGAPAGRLLGVKDPGVRTVKVKGTQLVVAVPGRDSVAPAGPLPARPAVGWQRPSRELAAACSSADLLVTLARLDPAVGGEHLASWATDAVVVVTAGRSSWTRIHAVGEMIRLAGVRLASAVLVGADKTDESLGVTHTPTPSAPVGSGLKVTSR